MRRNRFVAAIAAATPAVALAIVALSSSTPDPLLQTFPLAPAGAGLRLVAETRGEVAELPERATKRFSLVGVTWDDPKAAADGTIQVRTRPAGDRAWTPWRALETDAPDASGGVDGARVRGASDPLWVGPSYGVQARVVDADGARELPTGLRVDLINPEAATSARQEMVPVADRQPRRINGVEIPARATPRMLTRTGWGADEKIVTEAPTYTGPVEVFFVHHTATGNDYSCASSTSIVRGIEAYQVKSKGWNDIGYNFLVDKCGTIFEGRRGGVDRNVLGAHTLGFNTNASAVAVIGDYRSAPISAAARLSVAQLAAYKLGAAGNAPAEQVAVTSGGGAKFAVGKRVILNRISGHRDAGVTECPGDALYAQLPAIRELAGGAPTGLRVAKVTGAVPWGATYFTRGAVTPLWALTTPTQLLNRFDVYVDGALALSRAGGTRVGSLQLSPGLHHVAVQAVHLSGRTTTVTAKVYADVAPPAFTTLPAVSLTAGTVGSTAPIRLDWSATDPSGVRSVVVSGTSEASLDGDARSLTGTARVGARDEWTVAATDHAGNRRTASFSRTPVVLQESAAMPTGSWRAVTGSGHLGGAAALAASAASALSWTFTGQSVGLVAAMSRTAGRVKVYIDNEFQGYADLRSTSAQYRRVVFTKSWPDTAEHTVKVLPEGTAARPAVTVDGLVYLR
ncbi:N-acetylmuramoyl-L-alanine amidase [Actinoplanes regularis]|uniref:N-acetylmuramoyl-L-alanine amidase n=1 Tax=Actinoplanes regularis TaxID=52697 RepID=UPI0024A44BC0|nr:N-acetylmuramoyl-L-alanine amidase [Actinoplanes regularis]GLW32726.1 hypothetical protein Areg01_56640 [Actinoplanes regularis]